MPLFTYTRSLKPHHRVGVLWCSVKMDGTEDDVVFDYELLDENENDENSEVINFNSIDGEEYEEVGGSNVWE